MGKPVEVIASSAGEGVFEALLNRQEATVIGVISQGIYLITSFQEVIFISFNHSNSPLTLSFSTPPSTLKQVEFKTTVDLSPGCLVFPGLNVRVPSGCLWRPRSPIVTADNPSSRLERLKKLCEKIFEIKQGSGFSVYIPFLLGDETKKDSSKFSAKDIEILDIFLQVTQQITTMGVTRSITDLSSLLGYGRGLTPAGDDCVMGMLLVLNRWRELFTIIDDLDFINQSIYRAAQIQTTSLSACIIKWAIKGTADERLIKVVDWIMTGEEATLDECVNLLNNYGNSSGVDALVGILLLFL
jgi:hypothetical protein